MTTAAMVQMSIGSTPPFYAPVRHMGYRCASCAYASAGPLGHRSGRSGLSIAPLTRVYATEELTLVHSSPGFLPG